MALFPHSGAMTLVGALGLALLPACAGTHEDTSFKKPKPTEVARMRVQMAEALVQQRDFEQAMPYLRGLRHKYPDNARVRLLLGMVLREKGIYAMALQEMQLALKLAPRDPEVHTNLGKLHDYQRKHKLAEKLHRKAIKLQPKAARYHNNLGWCLYAQKRYEEALYETQEAIRLDPGLRRAFNNLGYVLGMMDQEEKAFEAFSQAGSRAMALTNMGWLHEMKGRPVSARRYYERALKAQHDYKPALRNLRAVEPQVVPQSQPQQTTSKSDGGKP